jgi:predicted RND superfamily exporter protein
VFEQVGQTPAPCSTAVAFPETEQEIRAEVDAMFASPMRELASIIVNHPLVINEPDRGMAAMTFSVRAATYNEAEEVWFQVWDAVEKANVTFGGQAPDGVRVAFVGNTATNYLFVAEELPWLTYMSVAATIILFFLVLAFTRDIKATLVATGLAGITSIWWLGVLPFINVGLAITLMLPLVFIFNIGTDYAVHIIWSLKHVGNAREVFQTTGKAILFSAITTAGAFAVFTFIRNVAVGRTMVATTLSIFVIFTATMLIIPIFYKVLPQGKIPRPEEKVVVAKRIKKAKS